MTKQDLVAIHRVFNTDDGRVLLNYLKELSNKNYENLLNSSPDTLAHFQGKAKVLFELVTFIEKLDKKVEEVKNQMQHDQIIGW